MFTGYPIPPGPDPALPKDGQLRMLVWLAKDYPGNGLAAEFAHNLENLILYHPDFDDVTVYSDTVFTVDPDQFSPTLLDHYFGWTNRQERLAILDDGWDYVLIYDIPWSILASVELYYAAVSRLADEIRAHGATPILLSNVLPVPDPNEDGEICTDQCLGGGCGDGGPGAISFHCTFGTDCSDCGPRNPADAPPEGPTALVWRVAVGTGCVLVHVPSLLSTPGYDSEMGVLTALFGQEVTTFLPDVYQNLAEATYARYAAEHATTHYSGPAQTVVRVSEMRSAAMYRFMTAGTSSEEGYAAAMGDLLAREGWPHGHESLGSCTPEKHVDEECAQVAVELSQGDVYQTLFARGYDVPSSAIGAPSLLTQIYDRHWDSTDDAGTLALNTIYAQSWPIFTNASEADLAWLPMRLLFGDLKIEDPATQLLSDGVHATDAIQAGLAAMSWVSRTGWRPPLAGLDAEATRAVEAGERVVRTLSSLTRSGLPIADTPDNRVVITAP